MRGPLSGAVAAPLASRHASVDLGGEAGALDARHRGGLVVVGGVAGDADRAEQVTVRVADEHAARAPARARRRRRR